ncbi:MAG: PIN domain nuclease [Dehalococcoidia bacterium]|nr:PIN domain nuclease [Dehalococcoidia bacterium]
MVVNLLVRLIGLVVCGYGGWRLGQVAAGLASASEPRIWVAAFVAAGALVGFFIAPLPVILPARWLMKSLKEVPTATLFASIVGLVLGLLVATLLALPLSVLPGLLGMVLPIVVAIIMGYLGVSVLLAREHDILQILNIPSEPALVDVKGSVRTNGASRNGHSQVVMDTSAIIDGRVADIAQTGFLHGTLVVPQFVLDELRHIADSSDPLRRNRGRRGLEMLNKLRKNAEVPVVVMDVPLPDVAEVDAKLVKLAVKLHSPILTTDYNLNRVAEIQGIKVLNVNELANALKPVVLPGEEMPLRVIQEGKEAGQGIGFLDDGTMVVVESGRRYINTDINVVVTRVLQTAAGRIIFALPRAA